MDLAQIRAALRALPPEQLREVLAEFAPGDGADRDLAEIQFSLATDRKAFLDELASFSQET